MRNQLQLFRTSEPKLYRYLWRLLIVFCFLSLLADPLLHKHPYFGFDGTFGFYPLLGFAGAVLAVLAAMQWGRLVDHPEAEPDQEEKSS